jgi:hypothetical protein
MFYRIATIQKIYLEATFHYFPRLLSLLLSLLSFGFNSQKTAYEFLANILKMIVSPMSDHMLLVVFRQLRQGILKGEVSLYH